MYIPSACEDPHEKRKIMMCHENLWDEREKLSKNMNGQTSSHDVMNKMD
jgi:hypothetical protein